MAQFVNIYPVDLQKGPVEVSLNRMYLEDIKANRVGVTVTYGGAAVTLGGTCSGTAILSNGSTVAISGTISGNQAYIELPSAVYTVDGPVEVFVNLTNGGVTVTLLHGHGTVVQTDTGTVIDPGTIIPSVSALIAAIDAAVESIPQDYSALSATVAGIRQTLTNAGAANNSIEKICEGFVPYPYVLEQGNIQNGSDSTSSFAKRVRPLGYLSTADVRFIVNKAIHPSKIYAVYYDASLVYQTTVDLGKVSAETVYVLDQTYPFFRFVYICYEASDSDTQIDITPVDGYAGIVLFTDYAPVAGNLMYNNIIAAKNELSPVLRYPILEQGNIQGVQTEGFLCTEGVTRGNWSSRVILVVVIQEAVMGVCKARGRRR